MMPGKRIIVLAAKLTSDEADECREAASEDDVTVSKWIRRLIADALVARRKTHNRSKRA